VLMVINNMLGCRDAVWEMVSMIEMMSMAMSFRGQGGCGAVVC
jgi:hypothetical protein